MPMVADGEARHRWAELLRRIFEIDPLACPRWPNNAHKSPFITEPKGIDLEEDIFPAASARLLTA